jgi:FkbM family methyltransferase
VLYKLLRQIEVRSQWAMGKGYSAPAEREVALALRASGGSPAVVVDGGANIGDWSAAVLAQHSPMRLLLIEPDPGNATRLRTRFADAKNATVAEVALSDRSGEATLFADSSGSGLGSLTNRDLTASGIAFKPMATVKTDTIAGLMDAHGLDRIDLLKLDIEGHELTALSVAPLDRIGVIQFEFGGANIDSKTYFRDFWTLLSPSFDIFRISPFGLAPVRGYREQDETFVFSNYICVRK